MIISPKILIFLLVIALIGYGIVHIITNRKWGFTKKREAELSRQPEWHSSTPSKTKGLRRLFQRKRNNN